MPRTPPIILPGNSTESWFNANIEKGIEEGFDSMRDDDLSPFTFSPSDEDESAKSAKNNKRNFKEDLQQENRDNLYHKPTSNHSTQYDSQYNSQNNNHSSQRYELIDDNDNQNAEEQHTGNTNYISETQEGEPKFDSAIEGMLAFVLIDSHFKKCIELRTDFKLYTEEYKDFKR